MLVTLLDGNGQPHIVTWKGQDLINDASGALGAPAVGAVPVPQVVAAANLARAGFLFQNTSAAAMVLFDTAAAFGWLVQPGQYFPPNDSYPVPTGAISVIGTYSAGGEPNSNAGDTFTYREWVNGPNE